MIMTNIYGVDLSTLKVGKSNQEIIYCSNDKVYKRTPSRKTKSTYPTVELNHGETLEISVKIEGNPGLQLDSSKVVFEGNGKHFDVFADEMAPDGTLIFRKNLVNTTILPSQYSVLAMLILKNKNPLLDPSTEYRLSSLELYDKEGNKTSLAISEKEQQKFRFKFSQSENKCPCHTVTNSNSTISCKDGESYTLLENVNAINDSGRNFMQKLIEFFILDSVADPPTQTVDQ